MEVSFLSFFADEWYVKASYKDPYPTIQAFFNMPFFGK